MSTAATNIVDLRSDTFTKPTPAMRRAMGEAEVGDDVYLEDPTVNRLEKRAAEIFGKEAALFVPSGCMGNLIAIKVWTHHGDEVICEERSHVNLYELASMSAIAGAMPRIARSDDGILTWKKIEAVIRPKIYYDSQTALVCLENTHNMAGGTLYPTAQVNDICCHTPRAKSKSTSRRGAHFQCCGRARGMRGGHDAESRFRHVLSFERSWGARWAPCLLVRRSSSTKPASTAKCSAGACDRRACWRRLGSLRSNNHPRRLHEDHDNAKYLAQEITTIPNLGLDASTVKTNIVIFDCERTGLNAVEFCEALQPHGILALDTSLLFRPLCHALRRGPRGLRARRSSRPRSRFQNAPRRRLDTNRPPPGGPSGFAVINYSLLCYIQNFVFRGARGFLLHR